MEDTLPIASIEKRPHMLRRAKNLAVQVRKDFFQTVPAEFGQSVFSKFRWRFMFLFKKYGWKMILAIFVYYLVRDTTLYVLIPFLIARKVLGE